MTNCKICRDPIFNKYAHRWFHTWTHDHWAVREDQETSECELCHGIIHYNDNRWWHVQNDRCNSRYPIPKNKKCYEIKSYIEYLINNSTSEYKQQEIDKYKG